MVVDKEDCNDGNPDIQALLRINDILLDCLQILSMFIETSVEMIISHGESFTPTFEFLIIIR